jgi:predicted enzyme related to lactoylglutathione lyase
MGAPVTHFEVSAKDLMRAREFYSALFGWKIGLDSQMHYGMVDTGVKMGINGGIGQATGENPKVTFYVQVEDVQGYLDKAVGLGGKVVVPLTEVPEGVTFAQFSDPDGNVIGLVKGPQTPPREAKPKKTSARRRSKSKPGKSTRRVRGR